MTGVLRSTLIAVTGSFLWWGVASATEYTVPITITGTSYVLTVTMENDNIAVASASPALQVGAITEVKPAGLSLHTVAATSELSATAALVAQAVALPYDDLFRFNERYVGTVVRYVGEVVQVQQVACKTCTDPFYNVRVNVTPGAYGFWDDTIYVLYEGKDRFLEDDIVTLWGTVDGLESYTAVLGNEITIPRIKSLVLLLGEQATAFPAPKAEAGSPAAASSANLRGGPGTTYALVGGVESGDALSIIGRNEDGSWFELANGQWIAAFLVTNAPALTEVPLSANLPVAAPAPVSEPAPTEAADTTAPAPTEETAATESSGSSMVTIGQEIEGNGWRFKVSEIHKRKAVYFYDESYVAMGEFLVVIVDAVNLQSGTDYFDRTLDPWLTDDAGKAYGIAAGASGYAKWQFGGLESIFTSVNPGNLVRMALVYDVPESVGAVYLSTAIPAWVKLGNFAEMVSEDKK